MKLVTYLLSSLLFLLSFVQPANAQCPATLTLTVSSSTPASCPDNGSVTLGGNGVGNPLVTFSIIAGPSRVGSTQTSPVFNSLTSGTYTFRASCNSQTVDVNATITSTYTAMDPGFLVTVSDVCNSYLTGGTITVTGVSGGRAPIQYSFIQNGAANYNDALSNYSSTNTFTTTSWGVYQVRIKDACGVFLTRTVNLQPFYRPVKFGGGNVDFEGVSCDSAGLWFWMGDDSDQGLTLGDYPSLKFEIFEKASNCVPGALIKSFTLNTTDNQYFIIPKRDVVVRITTPCGDIRTNCYDYPDDDAMVSNWQPMLKGCGGSGDPYTMTVKHLYNIFARPDITVRLYNNATNTLLQTVNNAGNYNCCTFNNLPSETYRVELTDACGRTATTIINPPAGTPGVTPVGTSLVVDPECTYTDGKTTVKLTLTGPATNLDITTLTITSGPDNIGAVANYTPSNGLFMFFDMTPGATYGVSVSNGCSPYSLSFTVPILDWSIVHFTMAPTVTQQCGGTGTIAANIVYGAWGNFKSELWLGATKIDENNSGNFSNVSPGLYTVKAVALQEWCENRKRAEISDTVRVYNDATPPQLLRQFGFVCDQPAAIGGRASIEVGGFGPFKYELKRTSPSPEAAYTTIATNAPGNYTFNNLDAYAVYSLLITDNCGKSTVSELVIGNIGNLSFTNPYQPCVGSPYLLSATDIPNATYSWTRKSSTIILSGSKDLYFANYLAAYDGDYVCTITLSGGCSERTIDVTLNSATCGALLPVKLGSIYARSQNCQNQLSWSTAEAGTGVFEIQRSIDGKNFETIDKINFNTNGASAFSSIDANPAEGINYYRLKLIDANGKFGYSKMLSINKECFTKGNEFSLYPNPVVGTTATLFKNSNISQSVEIAMMNANGQLVKQIKINVNKGQGQYTIDMNGLSAGSYFLRISSKAVLLQNMKLIKR